jgi:hopanoid biosynthesis associated protein HpnK
VEARGGRLTRLIVTGDDFGFSKGVNRAIVEAHGRGILTSASLMVTGDAAQEAVALAHRRPSLAVGLHLVVVRGKAALPPWRIPRLVDARGFFSPDPVRSGLRYAFSRAARRELREEIRGQLELFRQTGLELSHVDGHLHMHLHPAVLSTLVELSGQYRIPAIRLPAEELGTALSLDPHETVTKLAWSWIFGWLRRRGERSLGKAGIRFTDRCYGLLATGRITEAYLLGLLPRIRGTLAEIYCHPAAILPGEPLNGPPGAGPRELAALTSPRVRGLLEARGFTLSTHADAPRPNPAEHVRTAAAARSIALRASAAPEEHCT